MKKGEGARSIRVGIFLVVAVAALVAAVFLLGRSQSLFSRKVTLFAWFENTSGLVVGAPVRLAGVDIGIVQGIRFERDIKEKKVHVRLGVEAAYLDRIRQDSIARLSSKGLLGDTIVDISVGSADQGPHKDGDTLAAQEVEGLTEIIQSVQEAIREVRKLTVQVEAGVDKVLTDRFAKDLGRIAHSTANVIERVEKGGGVVHQLVYDKQMALELNGIIEEARVIVGDLGRAVQRVDRVIAAVEKGDGTLHALLYRDDTKQIFAEIQRAAKEIADVVAAVQHGGGVLHTLIYDEDRKNLLENLTALSRTLRDLGEEVEQGKGTVGALLKDPTVYEDLKTILGNVKRNRLLKTLVRYTIEKDELRDLGKVRREADHRR